jgi:uncharacterized lipoprotein YmbA
MPLRARVIVTVTALGWNASGEARLEANWGILSASGEQALARGRAVLRKQASGKDAASAVAATSALVTELAHEIASAVRALPPKA